ncbi:MAG: hypothetical protein JOZ65_11340 [Chloroflexi bacterium]|nr:hypothetical protein [Chloroflexota bacterium]
MTFALALAAIRRHSFSATLTAVLAVVTASLLGVSVAFALAAWTVTALLSLELWYVAEPLALQRFGNCRPPTAAEQLRVEVAIGRSPLEVLIADRPDFSAARGLRCLAIGRDLLDILEDRPLGGYLAQTIQPAHAANLAGFILVWIGNLPVLAALWATRLVGLLGRLLALAVGTSLIVPLVVCREGFLRWVGLAFTGLLVSLLGIVLVSYGYTAAGLGVMLAWLLVPLIGAVLGSESRRAEWSADRAVVEAGLGPQLLEAIDFLALAEMRRPTLGLLSLLCLPGETMVERTRRIRRQLVVLPDVD